MPIDSYYKPGYTVQRPVSTVDAGGAPIESFVDLVAVEGRMRPLTGNEILANEALGLKTTDRFYCSVFDVAERDRIYDGNKNKTYEIKFVKNPMEIDDHLEIDCELIADPSTGLPAGSEYFVTADGKFFYESASKQLVVLET